MPKGNWREGRRVRREQDGETWTGRVLWTDPIGTKIHWDQPDTEWQVRWDEIRGAGIYLIPEGKE
jgi:hypothetical protein